MNKIILLIVISAVIMSGCAGKMNEIDFSDSLSEELCSMAQTAKTDGDYAVLTKKLFEVFGDKALKPLIREEGIYIKLSGFFVMEDGYFIMLAEDKSKINEHGDPSYKHVKGCIYRYHISG